MIQRDSQQRKLAVHWVDLKASPYAPLMLESKDVILRAMVDMKSSRDRWKVLAIAATVCFLMVVVSR